MKNQVTKVHPTGQMHRVLLMLGSNAWDAPQALAEAQEVLNERVQIIRAGSIWQTPAWGFEGPDFLNQVLEAHWEEPLEALMAWALEVEKRLGRVRNPSATTYENRRMDIDLILWSGGEYRVDSVVVPHPRMEIRRFVLHPLAEHWGEWQHPIQKCTVSELLTRCSDENLIHLHQTTEN
ncbi:MAG: 2-amino-4-hydroxy-6-hydroxymethyldihydropteridine diphosphokinase [Bacteroidota bacterium]